MPIAADKFICSVCRKCLTCETDSTGYIIRQCDFHRSVCQIGWPRKEALMKIYVAGASKEIDMVERYIRILRDTGHVITVDWCAEIRKVGDANPRDLPREENAKFAEDDLSGVRQADLFWLLIPQSNSAGCWIEFGYACAMRRRPISSPEIFVSGDYGRSIFCALKGVHCYDSHDEALRAIGRYAL